jgi:hypothetical protein
MKQVIRDGGVPIKIWTEEVEDSALTQLKNLSRLPFIARNGVPWVASLQPPRRSSRQQWGWISAVG